MPVVFSKSIRHGLFAVVVLLLGVSLAPYRGLAQSEGKPEGKEAPNNAPASEPQRMDNERLGQLLTQKFADRVVGGRGSWRIDLTPREEEKKEEDAPQEPRDQEPGSNTENADEQPDDQPPPQDDNEEEPGDEEGGFGPGAGNRLPATMIVLTAEPANRMRLMMPIRPFDPNNVEDLRLALIALHANHDRALDARYTIQDGILWSVFIHPLGSLTPADLNNAIAQVRRLRETTGTTYSSSDLQFGNGGGGGDDAPQPDDPRNDVI